MEFTEIVSWLDYEHRTLWRLKKLQANELSKYIELHIELDSVIHGILRTIRR